MEAKAAEIIRKQRELTVRHGNVYIFYCMNSVSKKDSNPSNRPRRKMAKCTDNRESCKY